MNQLLLVAAVEVEQCVDDICDLGNIPKVEAGSSQLQSILQIVFAIIGVIAVVYIVLAGFKLITSLGNPEALAKARQTIIFAAIGLAVALSAELIVSIFLGKL